MQPRADLEAIGLGQLREHVALLVALASLDRGVRAEDVGGVDHRAQGLRTVDPRLSTAESGVAAEDRGKRGRHLHLECP